MTHKFPSLQNKGILIVILSVYTIAVYTGKWIVKPQPGVWQQELTLDYVLLV